MNPIENLWTEIGKKLNKFQKSSKRCRFSKKKLEIWNFIYVQYQHEKL